MKYDEDNIYVVHLVINPKTDGLEGLYIDGQLQIGGDWYHDKAGVTIPAFIAGMQFAGMDVKIQRLEIEVPEEETWNGLYDALEEYIRLGYLSKKDF